MYLTKRQRQILDYIESFVSRRGYAPSLAEIARRFRLSSLATVHKHLCNLEERGAIRRQWNRSRSIEPVALETAPGVELPLLGVISAGRPVEALAVPEVLTVPEEFSGGGRTYVLRVRGDSMIEEQIRDGDYVIVEERRTARNGETVVALLHGEEATLKKFFRKGKWVTLVPANPDIAPISVHPREIRIQGVVVAVLRKYR